MPRAPSSCLAVATPCAEKPAHSSSTCASCIRSCPVAVTSSASRSAYPAARSRRSARASSSSA
eukprot:6302831-Prymnesium_polylepis.1